MFKSMGLKRIQTVATATNPVPAAIMRPFHGAWNLSARGVPVKSKPQASQQGAAALVVERQ
jgi:hypothetical protein